MTHGFEDLPEEAPIEAMEPMETEPQDNPDISISDRIMMIPAFNIPSEEEMRAKREAGYAWTRTLLDPEDVADRDATSAPARVNPLSLPAWLAVAEAAGVPHIPARPLAECCAEEFRDSLDNRNDATAYDDLQSAMLDGLKPGEMIRMEQVAPRDIKATLSEGGAMITGAVDISGTGELYVDLYEDRYLSTFLDLGADRVRAFARPIVTPAMICGTFDGAKGEWPAEFRVFVENGRLVGLSNYYPQVVMDPALFAAQISDVLRHAQSMLDAMTARRLGVGNHSLAPDTDITPEGRPDWVPAHWDRQDFTLDFMILEDMSVTFLEGGPAGMRAAHPCCFLQDGRPMGPEFLHGAAFSTTDPILPLDRFTDPA